MVSCFCVELSSSLVPSEVFVPCIRQRVSGIVEIVQCILVGFVWWVWGLVFCCFCDEQFVD